MNAVIDTDLAKAIRTTGWLRTGFYVVVLGVALGGQVSGAMEALGMQWYIALPAVGALELGGIVVLANADVRRRLGEHALLSQLLSAGIAFGAVAFNWLAHTNHLEGGFYAGMSLLGYLVYLMNSANKRRDRLRARGQLEAAAPPYGLGQWLGHPGITRRARALALENAETRLAEGEHPRTPALGKLASLAAAREQVRTERREAGLAKAVRNLIAAGAGDDMAAIAVDTYDMKAIAQRLAKAADYDGISGLLAGRLTAEKLAGSSGSSASAPARIDDLTALVDIAGPTLDETVEAAVARHVAELPAPQVSTPIRTVKRGPISDRPSRRLSAKKERPIVINLPPTRAARTTEEPAKKATPRTTIGRPSAAEKVAKAARLLPGAALADIAKKAGVTPDTAKKHLSAVNGNAPDLAEVTR